MREAVPSVMRPFVDQLPRDLTVPPGYTPDDPRANAPLQALSPDQRAELWRRRAVVHAVIRRWDERLRWSQREGWRSIAGWEGDTPLLIYPWAFSRAEGQRSAALDLATFAEELLVPPESLAPELVPVDEHIRCREPTKARFLDERLRALDPSWNPPHHCPALERWTSPDAPPRFEVLFSTPSSTSAQAMAGHVLLRIVREGEGPDEGQVMQLAALISPLEPPGSFLARGLAGGFRGVFALAAMADVRHEALGLEQRALRRLPLVLPEGQRVRLMERVWELERVGYIRYAFFHANCATMLRFLLAPVLGARGPKATVTPWETPTQVMEGLAGWVGDVETELASGQRARWWESRDGFPSPRPSPPRGEREFVEFRLARAALDQATVARIKAERAAVLPGWQGPTTEELVRSRQRRFELKLPAGAHREAELSELLALDALLRAAPRRPYTEAERRAFADEQAARDDFERVAAQVAELPEPTLERARTTEEDALRDDQAAWRARAVPETGHGHAQLGVGVTESATPLFRLRVAALRELLGDQRLFGFGPRSAWRLLDASVDVRVGGAPLERAGLTVLQLRSLSEAGWGGGGGLDYAFLEASHEVAASGELLRGLASNLRFQHFLLLSVGARAGVRTEPLARFLLQPHVALEARVQLPGSLGNALRLALAYAPRLRAGHGVDFEHGAQLNAAWLWRLGVVGGLAFTARLDLGVAWRLTDAPTGQALVGFELD